MTQQHSKPLPAMSVAVLSLLMEGPLHPYEMYQTLIERHEDRNVKLKPGTLYHAVDRLADANLIEVSGIDREGNRPERTTYSITDEGTSRLTTDIVSLLGTRINEYPRFPQALSEAHNLPREVVKAQLRSRIEQADSAIEELAFGRETVNAKHLPKRFWLDVDYLETIYNAERQWIAEFVLQLENREIDWPDSYSEAAAEQDHTLS